MNNYSIPNMRYFPVYVFLSILLQFSKKMDYILCGLTIPCLAQARPNPSCRKKYTCELKFHGFTGREEDFRVNHRGKENSFLEVTPGSVP